METENISRWMQDALGSCPGAVRSVVRRQLVRAIREFYELSSCLREVAERDVLAEISSYAIVPDMESTTVQNILQVHYNNRELDILTRKPARRETVSTSPYGWYKTGINTVNLYPTPRETIDNGLSIYLILKPDTDDDLVPSISYDRHFDAIMDGLLSRLYRQPSKPYTNFPLAEVHMKRFRSEIAVYKGEANKGGVPRGAGWTFNRFGK